MRTPSALKYGQNDNFSLSSSLPSSYYKKYFETDYNHHNQPSIRSESYFSSSRYEPRSILLRSFDPKASYISDMESRAEMQKGISKPSIQGCMVSAFIHTETKFNIYNHGCHFLGGNGGFRLLDLRRWRKMMIFRLVENVRYSGVLTLLSLPRRVA